MKLYKIRDEYYELLHRHDNKVLFNKNEKRPYVGVVLKINHFNYYIPLSSPKPKHQSMKNNKDFIKLDGGNLGALNINCMIPVDKKNLINFDIEKEEPKYRELLRNQLNVLRSLQDNIIKNAQYIYSLHNIKTNDLTTYQENILKRCCNFKNLEHVCYNQSYETLTTQDLIKNRFAPTNKLVTEISSLSCIFNTFQSLNDIKEKFKSIDTYPGDVQGLITNIVSDLQEQEQKIEIAITNER